MKPYESYKETSYVWLVTIPSHWEWCFLSQICTEKQVKNKNNSESNVLSLSYGSIIRKEDKNFGLVPKEYDTYQIVENGDIILRLTDLQNDHKSLRTGLVKERGIITSAYTCLKPKENSAYLQYLLHSFDTQKVFYGMGAGVRQSIGYSEIRNMRLPVPPRAEQDQIVRFLDWKLSKINKLIKAKKKQIALLNELKKAVINNAVTHGLNKNTAMKHSGVDWLGSIPTQWKADRLKRFCQVNASISHLTSNYKDDDLIVFLPMEKVSVQGEVDCTILRKFKDVKSGYSSFAKDDVVVAKITPCFENGKGACLDHLDTEIGYGSTEFITLRTYNNMLPKYLYYITRLSWFRLFGAEVMTGSAGQKRIPSDFISNFIIGVPDIAEQQLILDYVETTINQINNVISKVKGEIGYISEYKTSLISSVVTGKVDVRNVAVPDFEHEKEIFEEETDIENTEVEETEE